jgi:hypothetical protein
MESFIDDLASGLKAQLEALEQEIRLAETQLIGKKEGFLKVQGALELIGIIKQKQNQQESESLLAGIE